jgi:DNA-binding response OmpR family regulator
MCLSKVSEAWDGGCVRILLVEDNAALNEVVCALLKELGHDAYCAKTVAEAVAAIATSCYDAAVVDWMLGEETCEPVLTALAEAIPPVPAVLYSASPSASELASLWSVAFVAKPFEIDALVGTVVDAVADRRSPQPPAPQRA